MYRLICSFQEKQFQINNTLNILSGIGHMIGAGIYVLTGTVAKDMAGPGIVLSFILAGLVSMVIYIQIICLIRRCWDEN